MPVTVPWEYLPCWQGETVSATGKGMCGAAGPYERCAILTYHRITDDKSQWDFYDTTWASFERQLTMLSLHGRRASGTKLLTELNFDDGTSDHMEVGERLAQRSLRATFFVVSDWVGRPKFLSEANLRQLVQLGHSIGSHTVSHPRLTALAAPILRTELEASKKRLEDLTGRAVDAFAAPGGYLDERVMRAARAAAYRTVRSMEWGYNTIGAASHEPLRTIPLFSTTSDARFAAILSGRASFASFRLKQAAKRLMGEAFYVRLRNAAGRLGGAP